MQSIKSHSLEKLQRHNYYAGMFARGMKNSWPQLAYLGLYSGPGRARVVGSNEIVETTPMSVLRLQDPFTKYVFVDKDPNCIAGLSGRIGTLPYSPDVSLILGDVNESVGKIRSAMPPFDSKRRLLSFCFVDPFAANLKFSTLAELARAYRMDFMILLALGVDALRNFRQYYLDRADSRIADLIDCPEWRNEYDKSAERSVVRFLLARFDEAMKRLGYRSAQPKHHHPVKIQGRGAMQYILVLYSKHRLGQKFWESTLAGSDPQLGLF
ncbi:MAG: three-Cys-motif partner protein TcmP [Candidatus Eisenbacteria bacterium]|nr:three-Cys-motif partner protein TcmP [Candidatus Eisenbacteria bacterium]